MHLPRYALLSPLSLALLAQAYPGMQSEGGLSAREAHPQILDKILGSLTGKLPDSQPGDTEPPNEIMIGDLATTGATTSTGRTIKNILLGNENPESNELVLFSGVRTILGCLFRDQCCKWSLVSAAMTKAFTGPSGRCNDLARAAVRAGFHDAGSWSTHVSFGGADGSLVCAAEEITRGSNKGLEQIVAQYKTWASQFKVGMADLIQFGANHATVTCPLGPRVRTWVGRKDDCTPNPTGLLPDARDDVENLIKLFEDKTISPHELAALVGAHTTSRQFNFDPSRSGAPQDSTPGVWDVEFYNQTFDGHTPPEVVRLPSDVALSKHPRTADEWADFIKPNGEGQRHWNEDYARAYIRLSLLGVNNINGLKECTKVLPPARPDFAGALEKFVIG